MLLGNTSKAVHHLLTFYESEIQSRLQRYFPPFFSQHKIHMIFFKKYYLKFTTRQFIVKKMLQNTFS